MLRSTKFLSTLLAAAGIAALVSQPAAAADFYAGKQMKITIGYGFGGTYGKYSRMFSEPPTSCGTTGATCSSRSMGVWWRSSFSPRR